MARPSTQVGGAGAVIRPFVSGDLERCAHIFDRAWHAGHPYAPRTIDAAVLRRESVGETLLVAEAGGGVAGFGAIYRPGRFVHHLYVDPPWQGRGIGAALLRALVALADPPVTLKCQTRNARALAFYRRCGWREGERGASDWGEWVRFTAPE